MAHDWKYLVKLDRVVDGDTIDFDVDLGFNVRKKVRVRLKNIDTHEIYGVKKESEEYQKGKKEAEFVEEVLKNADKLAIQSYKNETGKFGRYLAEVKVDDEHLTDLIKEEFSYFYD